MPALNSEADFPAWAPPGASSASAPAEAPPSSDVQFRDGRPTITVHPKSYYSEADFPKWEPSQKGSSREIGAGEAAVHGVADAATFGAAPVIAGLQEAGRATPEGRQTEEAMRGVPSEAPGMENLGVALAHMLGSHPDPEVHEAYERGRDRAREDAEAAREQHPYAYFGGQVGGSFLTPGFGAAAPGTLPARLATGAIAGGIGGGLYGGGSGLSQGHTGRELAEDTAGGGIVGGVTGGLLKGVVGPRAPAVPRAPVTAGQKAAATAEELGAPLPRGLASDSPTVQATTSRLISAPFTGEGIRHRVEQTVGAAGERIGDIAAGMGGGERAAADLMVRPGLRQVIDDNRAAIDRGYSNVRNQVDQNTRFTMPRTGATLNHIMQGRSEAGWSNPEQGLEQFQNIARGATFNGAHRARVDARNAGNPLVPHPGYDAGDFNRLTRAMTADIRDVVQQGARRKGNDARRALVEFDAAEREFGRLSEQNDRLHDLLNSKGEGGIATLLRASKERSGDVKLLAQLKASMHPQEFQVVGGQLLHELGESHATSDFSLGKFVTNWNKVSSGAKRVLFSPQHLQNINDIVGMGEHIKGALKFANTSHTAGALILYELGRDAVEGGIALGAGLISPMAAVGSVATVGAPIGLAWWLGQPAKAASMAAWTRAYQAAQAQPTAARVAAFKIATRNLANTLGLDPARVAQSVQDMIAGQ
jgi:hypothetical protein